MMDETCRFYDLLGKTLVNIVGKVGDEEMIFTTSLFRKYKLYHEQSCCEYVSIVDICGNLGDLLNSKILLAEETGSLERQEDFEDSDWQGDSFTWTFYKLATIKGYVTIRWYGESNGHYSERVDFRRIK